VTQSNFETLVRQKMATARRLGASVALQLLLGRVRRALLSHESLVVFRLRPGELRPVTADFALGEAGRLWSTSAEGVQQGELAPFPPRLDAELRDPAPTRRLHLIEVDGRIAAWGFSTVAVATWPLTETASTLAVEPGGVCLTAFETIPEYRGRRFYPSILTRIVEERFAEGVPAAYIWCATDNRASYNSIKRVGFREIAIHRRRRVLGISRLIERQLEP
jgi:ribosomal protein S18 acetylase RimI-like enzyme